MPSKHLIGTFAVGLLATMLIVPATAQTGQPDITGEWTLNKQRSVMGQRVSVPVAITIEVSFEDDKYTFKRTDEGMRGDRTRYEEVFTIDGEVNETETEAGKSTITASWMNNSLIVDRSRAMAASSRRGRGAGGGGGSRQMTYTTTYTMAPDGKILIAFIDFGEMPMDPITLAYEKK